MYLERDYISHEHPNHVANVPLVINVARRSERLVRDQENTDEIVIKY